MDELVHELLQEGRLRARRVADAMRKLDRKHFLEDWPDMSAPRSAAKLAYVVSLLCHATYSLYFERVFIWNAATAVAFS